MTATPSPATMEGSAETLMATSPAGAPRRMLESSASYVRLTNHTHFVSLSSTLLLIFKWLRHRLHLSAGDGGRNDRGVPDFRFLCALRHYGSSALGSRVGSAQQPRYSQRLDIGLPRQEPVDRGERRRRLEFMTLTKGSRAANDHLMWTCPQQINMQKKMRLTGIITQGASRMGTAEYIKAFKMASSLDGKTYTPYRVDGQRRDKVGAFTSYDIIQGSLPPVGPPNFPCLCASGFCGQHRQRQHQDQPFRPSDSGPLHPHHPGDLPQGVHAANGADWLWTQW